MPGKDVCGIRLKWEWKAQAYTPQQVAWMPTAPAPEASPSTSTYGLMDSPCDLFTEKGNNRPGLWMDLYDGLVPGSRQMLG